jgi:putative two-component system response regulator
MKRRLLFVDDEPNVLASLARLLRAQSEHWDMQFVDCPRRAWSILEHDPGDVVVTDMRMPGMTGLELLERMQSTPATKDVPVVVLTGDGDRHLRRVAIEAGATDLLNKPVDPDDLVARVRSALRLKAHQDDLKTQNERLEIKVRQRTADLAQSRLNVIRRLAKASEYRDEDTGQHVLRVGGYCRAIARALRLEEATTESIFLTAPLHDVGKIGIPDAILLKAGKLTAEEWEIMKQHCVIGAKILREDIELLPASFRDGGLSDQGQSDALLLMAAEIALNHHEKWDGSGYPAGLAGSRIPLEARIVSISDVFDALVSHRPYKAAFSEDKALEILAAGAGKHFDPDIYAAFVASLDEIRAIRREFSDAQADKAEVLHEACTVCR